MTVAAPALRRRNRRRWLPWAAGLLLLLVGFFGAAPRIADRMLNPPPAPATRPVPAAVLALHRRLPIADLHADTLLWGRDLTRAGSTGHADLPRLQEGGVVLQAFSVVTKVPFFANLEDNGDDSDMITILALADRWPLRTLASLFERALYLAGRLHELEKASAGALRIVRTREDLRSLLADHEAGRRVLGAVLTLEGAHALEGDIGRLDALARAGYRVIAPTHFFDNEIAGSAHGRVRGGLTPTGRRWLERMEAMELIVDLAHASPATIDEVLVAAKRPVLVTHTGVRATCDNRRNLDDERLRAIARGGGLIGIGFWPEAVCGTDVDAIAAAILHAIGVAGIDHVALGSDFDGTVRLPIDAARLAEITMALRARGLADGEVSQVMGGNVLRFFGRHLPAR